MDLILHTLFPNTSAVDKKDVSMSKRSMYKNNLVIGLALIFQSCGYQTSTLKSQLDESIASVEKVYFDKETQETLNLKDIAEEWVNRAV